MPPSNPNTLGPEHVAELEAILVRLMVRNHRGQHNVRLWLEGARAGDIRYSASLAMAFARSHDTSPSYPP